MSSVSPRFCAQFLLDLWPESKEDLEFYDYFEKMAKIPGAQIRIQRAESFAAYQASKLRATGNSK